MRRNLFAALAATSVMAASGSAASAAVIDYSAVIDLDPSMVDSYYGGLLAPLPGAPISISVGDTLQGTISFANHGRITIFDNLFLDGLESFSASFSPDYYSTAYSVGTLEFLGVEGDLLGPKVLTSSQVFGAMGFGKFTNLTNTKFSFTGVRFSITYVDRRTSDDFSLSSHITPAHLSIPYGYLSISEGSAVPEPATWATLIAGFAVTGGVLRRRRTPKAALNEGLGF